MAHAAFPMASCEGLCGGSVSDGGPSGSCFSLTSALYPGEAILVLFVTRFSLVGHLFQAPGDHFPKSD